MDCSDFDTSKKANICSENLNHSLLALNVNDKSVERLIQILIDKKVALTSTLSVFEPYTGREAIPGGGGDALMPQLREVVEQGYRDSFKP